MTTLDYLKPGSDEARMRGCTCPSPQNHPDSGDPSPRSALSYCDPTCPLHGLEGVFEHDRTTVVP
jgi:hypothetical protein